MARPGTTLSNQQSVFDDIVWEEGPDPSDNWRSMSAPQPITGQPHGLRTGMIADMLMPPYWEFAFKTDNTKGLVISNVVVRNSQNAGSTEQVFDTITFADIEVGFSSANIPFNVGRALLNPASRFDQRQNGTRIVGTSPPDTLFQYGLKLTLVDNVLTGSGMCQVVIELSVVFRGANNDIDPGGIPVGMKVWPQITCTWNNIPLVTPATDRVIFFQGNIKLTANNRMFMPMGPQMSGNVASFFTDSNTSMRGNQRGNILTGRPLRNTIGVLLGAPSGWGLLFDYNKLDIDHEVEEFTVFADPPGYARPGKIYIWPDPSDITSTTYSSASIELNKNNRQMSYDNIHLHARMHTLDPFGNPQIHAPFCGHSCIHSHWRWTSFSSKGATGGRGWQFRGWSTGGSAQAYTTDNAPLVPPNQQINVALTKPGANMFSSSQIVDHAAPPALDPDSKLLWYRFVISKPNANEKQVTMDHGLGWAYRYCTVSENSIIKDLYGLIHPVVGALLHLPQVVTVLPTTRQETSDFFEFEVYPFFRYVGEMYDFSNKAINQVPPGSYTKVDSRYSPGTMEGL